MRAKIFFITLAVGDLGPVGRFLPGRPGLAGVEPSRAGPCSIPVTTDKPRAA